MSTQAHLLTTEEQVKLDRQAYDLATEYLLGFDRVTPEILKAQLLPIAEKPTTLAAIYSRLLESAANRTMGPNVILKAIGGVDNLSGLLAGFEPRAVVEKYGTDSARVLADVQAQLTPNRVLRATKQSLWPLYCRTIVSGAAFLAQFASADEFYAWADFFDKDERARVALPMLLDHEIAGFGFALACDFIKELGYVNFGKPDVHLKYIFEALGLSSSQDDYLVFKAIVRVAGNVGVTAYNVDKLFWLIGSGSFYRAKFKVPADRARFVQFAKERL